MTTNESGARGWRARREALEAEHAQDDSRLEIAESLWNALDGGVGNNLKSIPRAVRTFRGVALRSQEGAERLATALKEWFEVSGQIPTRADFDDELYWAISRTRRDSGVESIRWLLATVSNQ
jgi:hypothetical protein